MPKFYRVEHCVDRKGPYQSRIMLNHDEWITASTDRHPIPLDDPILREHTIIDKIFGFSSLDQLLDWFNEEERTLLDQEGFWLSVYEIPYVIDGFKQAMIYMIDYLPKQPELILELV